MTPTIETSQDNDQLLIDEVREYMAYHGMTEHQFSAHAGLGYATVFDILSGRRGLGEKSRSALIAAVDREPWGERTTYGGEVIRRSAPASVLSAIAAHSHLQSGNDVELNLAKEAQALFAGMSVQQIDSYLDQRKAELDRHRQLARIAISLRIARLSLQGVNGEDKS